MNSQSFNLDSIRNLAATLAKLKSSQPEAGWPDAQMQAMADAEVYRWFIPNEQGGWGWSTEQITAAYVELSAACLSSTFILTQRVAALKRMALSSNRLLQDRILPGLLKGKYTATVGISHLTTSRQHVRRPVLQFRESKAGFVLNGFCPWITGANDATHLVVGAQDDSGNQLLAAVPTDSPGLVVQPGLEMIALTDTHTGAVNFEGVQVASDDLVAGPVDQVLKSMGAVSTGSFQTSALALGVAQAAIEFLDQEADSRGDLTGSVSSLRAQHDQLKTTLLSAAAGKPVCTNEQIRSDANQLVLRATQAAMVAAKGAGFVATHPVGRWCCEAMFFLVWSCPQAVRDANLCELAGLE